MKNLGASSLGNTLNVCLGHIAFPESASECVDLMIAPRPVAGPMRVEIVDDSYFGEHGSSLSEYVQLIWLFDNLDAIAKDREYVRIFQYRRFVSRMDIGEPSSLGFAKRISPKKLDAYSSEFSRACAGELFGRPVMFSGGWIKQYSQVHVADDLVKFAGFLFTNDVLSAAECDAFLREQRMIPASSMGIFRPATLKSVVGKLKQAAEFVRSPYFLARNGYQRRNVGFLLERLNSYLLLSISKLGGSNHDFGYHIVLADEADIRPNDGEAPGGIGAKETPEFEPAAVDQMPRQRSELDGIEPDGAEERVGVNAKPRAIDVLRMLKANS